MKGDMIATVIAIAAIRASTEAEVLITFVYAIHVYTRATIIMIPMMRANPLNKILVPIIFFADLDEAVPYMKIEIITPRIVMERAETINILAIRRLSTV
jgi:hypothetical protein